MRVMENIGPYVKLRVEGHTDNGNMSWIEGGNQTLSEQRAEAVVAYLVRQGLEESQLVGQGYEQTDV